MNACRYKHLAQDQRIENYRARRATITWTTQIAGLDFPESEYCEQLRIKLPKVQKRERATCSDLT